MGNRCRKVLERYLEVRSETSSPVTVAHYRTHVTALLEFLRVHFPEVDSLEDLRRAPHIEAWLQSLAAAEPAYKNNTRNQIITHVRRFLADIRKWQWSEPPPSGLISGDDIPPREHDSGPSRNWRVRPSQARFASALGESRETPSVQAPLCRVLEQYLEIRRSTMAPSTLFHHQRQILSLIRFLGTHFPLLDSLAKLRRTHIEGWLEMLAKVEPPYTVCSLDEYVRRVQRFLEDIHEWDWPERPPSGLIQPQDFPAPASYSERRRAGKRLQGRFPVPGNAFHQSLKRYLDVRSATLRPSTVDGYRINVLSFFRFLERNFTDLHSLDELRRVPHIEAWLKELATAKPPFRNGTRRKRIRSVARFLQDIGDWDWTDRPPPGLFRWDDLPPAQKYLPRPLAPDVDERLLEGLRNDGGFLALGLIVARRTGLRIGELLRLELNCLTEDPSRRYSVRVPLGKLRNERVIPIETETAELIRTLRARRGQRPSTLDPDTGRPVELLFSNPEGEPLYTRLFARKLKSIAHSVGITDNVHPHRLRHTYATELLRNGMSLVGVMKLLGHRNIKMTLRYVEVTNEDLGRDYLQAMEKARHRYAGLKNAGNPESEDHGDPLRGIEAAFDSLVARVQVVRFDEPDPGRRKKIQRLVERLRRVQIELPTILS